MLWERRSIFKQWLLSHPFSQQWTIVNIPFYKHFFSFSTFFSRFAGRARPYRETQGSHVCPACWEEMANLLQQKEGKKNPSNEHYIKRHHQPTQASCQLAAFPEWYPNWHVHVISSLTDLLIPEAGYFLQHTPKKTLPHCFQQAWARVCCLQKLHLWNADNYFFISLMIGLSKHLMRWKHSLQSKTKWQFFCQERVISIGFCKGTEVEPLL